ncbi:hypothetical protein [Bacillus pseudomycoides]|uniref:hypothetical protein n=1 Tax=Bacillus pseudomycoides TaxID=64104 RepID=UPI000BECDA54|nr:hypothetical protein [Bacillus pseudomycoides]PEE06638.1 hypothetical protein CON86_07440 [Bacillus pseudomycoides]PEM65830.1 hypothetical protein CN632_29670 [Bacillus pseudomycoides]PHC86927.1 hypothetical protein COF63_10270 [Bacillus pseudomycoides]
MKHNINLWSFICSLICIGLFRLYFEVSPEMFKSFMNLIHVHPLFFLLVFTIGTFFAGIIGFSKMNNWIAMLRSIVTVLLTFLLSVFLTLTLVVGYALS